MTLREPMRNLTRALFPHLAYIGKRKGLLSKISIYGRDGKPSLTCQRTPSATMAPYRSASRYLRCGVRLQKEHGMLQAKSNRLNALGLCGNREARMHASGPEQIKSNDSTRLNQSPRKEHYRGLLQNHSLTLQRGARQDAKYHPTYF